MSIRPSLGTGGGGGGLDAAAVQAIVDAATDGLVDDVTPGAVPVDLAALETAVPAGGQPANRKWLSLYGTAPDYQIARVVGGQWVAADTDNAEGAGDNRTCFQAPGTVSNAGGNFPHPVPFIPANTRTHTIEYSGDNIVGNAGFSLGTTPAGSEVFVTNVAQRLTPTESAKTVTVALTAGTPYYLTSWAGGGSSIDNAKICIDDGTDTSIEPIEPMSTALPDSGTITVPVGAINYGSAELTADATIDMTASNIGDTAEYELVVPAGVTLTLPTDSTVYRGSIIDDFVNLIRIEKVDTDDYRVGIWSRPAPAPATLVTRQDITGGNNLFASLAEANDFDAANPAPATADKFSILDQVEGMRRLDGKLEFELRYPAAGITDGPTGADLVIRWAQTSNPFFGSSNDAGQNSVTGFELISESHPFDNFGGLNLVGTSNPSETIFYKGQPSNTNWWSGVGALAYWAGGGGGIPARADAGGNHSTATIVELRVMNAGA